MNNFLQRLTKTFSSSKKQNFQVILVDSVASANELAFMLNGEWDSCNSITLAKYDQAAISEAAALVGAKWCRDGDKIAFFPRVTEKVLLERYQLGERNFVNANLRCSQLEQQCLPGINLSHAFLNRANLTEANLTAAELSVADLREAKLHRANLSKANMFRTNLSEANLNGANMSGAKLHKACLKGANLAGADLSYADLTGADLRGAELSNVSLTNANLRDAMLTVEQQLSI